MEPEKRMEFGMEREKLRKYRYVYLTFTQRIHTNIVLEANILNISAIDWMMSKCTVTVMSIC